ncbi:MAG: hypothetical protein FWD48_08410 [Oscillospiraceae bacterium]|nr:hypothetical protein [Oscillospiraceae bacterium]
MKTRTKKASFWALIISVLMLTALLPMGTAFAATETFNAQFAAQFDGSVSDVNGWELGDIAATSFGIGETATISITFDEPVKFDENYAAIETSVPYPEYTAAITSFKLDGAEIAMGAAFINDEGMEKGSTLRLTICNRWNSDIEVQPLEVGGLDEFTSIEISFVVTVADADAVAVDAPVEAVAISDEIDGAFDPNGTYMAFINIQSENWNFRDEWESKSFGANGSDWASNGGSFDGSFDQLFHTDNGIRPGTFNNIELAGNGTYRVSAQDLTLADTCETFNILGVSTNIPLSGDAVQFSDVKVMMGGRTVSQFDGTPGNKAIVVGIDNNDKADFYRFHVINKWSSELGGDAGLFGYMMPADGEVIIEFTISGFAYDKAEEAVADAVDAGSEDAGDSASSDASAPASSNNDSDEGGFPIWIIFVIAGVLAVVIIIAVVAKKKK